MKSDIQTKDEERTTPDRNPPRKLRIKSSAKPPAPDPPETPCQVVID